jgi:hypothetical protein
VPERLQAAGQLFVRLTAQFEHRGIDLVRGAAEELRAPLGESVIHGGTLGEVVIGEIVDDPCEERLEPA